jgi:ribosomal-protein-alanine N-acetyltransferase
MNATLRFAEAGDLPRLLTLMRTAETAAHWSDQAYADRIARGWVLIANIDRHLVGALIFSAASPGEWEIENIVVDRAVRRQGIGLAMIRELQTRAKERACIRVHLEVRESNAPAIGLYRKLGFVETTRRANYYSNPDEAALLFTLAL